MLCQFKVLLDLERIRKREKGLHRPLQEIVF